MGTFLKRLKGFNSLSEAPGNLQDYAFVKAKIFNSITGELRGPFFTVGDAKDVHAAFKEAWAGVVAMLEFISP